MEDMEEPSAAAAAATVGGGAASKSSSSAAQQQQQVQSLMKLAGSVYRERGYAGKIEVSWMLGVYQEEASLIFERSESFLPPWKKEEYVYVRDLLDKETSRSAALLSQLLRRLEDRSSSWEHVESGRCDVDDLSSVASSQDPLLGATGSIGFSFFGFGWNVSLSTSVYISRLERWKRRKSKSWPLAPKVERWRPLFDDIADDNNLISGPALVEATKNELKEKLRADDVAALSAAWNLADVRGDGALDFDEFLLFVHLVNDWAKPLPPSLPPLYVPPSARTARNADKTPSTGSSAATTTPAIVEAPQSAADGQESSELDVSSQSGEGVAPPVPGGEEEGSFEV